MRLLAFIVTVVLSTLLLVPSTAQVQSGPKIVQPVAIAAETRYRPFDAVVISAADISGVEALGSPQNNPHDIVYLSLHNIPRALRPRYKALVDFTLNSLNPRYRNIKRTASLPAGSDDPVVIRVNLNDYGIDKKAWERFVSTGSGTVPLPEPYFYTRVVKLIDEYETETYTDKEKTIIGYYEGDRNRPAYEEKEVQKTRRVKKGQKKDAILATAPWIALETDVPGASITVLLTKTQNKFPIVRADWFITYATWAPAYYDLIGLRLQDNPDKAKQNKVFLEKDFEKLMGFNLNEAVEDIVAAITDTKIVTLHNRVVHRYTTTKGIMGGSYWKSQDTDSGIDDEDYLNQIDKFRKPKIKAQEIISSGRNGLNFYALTDNKGVILNVAVATIAIHGDTMPTKLQDKQVFSARNCMFCHAGGQIFLKDRVRNIAQDKIAALIAEKTKGNPELARQIEEAFQPPTKPIIDSDNAKFVAAVRAASGMDAKELGIALETAIHAYFDQPISLDRMAWESGWDRAKLDTALRRGIGLDYTATAVLQNPPEDVYRLAWERQGFAALMQYLLGYKEN